MPNKKKPIYYIAYGSNLNIAQMENRCPGAKRIGRTTLNNHRLIFRGTEGNAHATVEVAKGYKVPVVIWEISMRNEIALDAYEGVPTYYRKEYFPLRIGEKIHDALLYIMNGRDIAMPSDRYYEIVREGYEDAGFETETLETALIESTERSN